jgi:hypothetical protein
MPNARALHRPALNRNFRFIDKRRQEMAGDNDSGYVRKPGSLAANTGTGNFRRPTNERGTKMFSTAPKLLLCMLSILVITNCAGKRLGSYEEFVEYSKPGSRLIRLPVIIVPGIKGSLLKNAEKEYWGKSYRVAFLSTFDELQFPVGMQLDGNFADKFAHFYATKGIREGGVMEKYCIALEFMNVWDVSIYKNIKNVLIESGGYHFEKDLFMFSYDWRLDNRISAAQLSYRVKIYQDSYFNYLKGEIFKNDEGGLNKFLKKLGVNKLLTRDGRVKVNLIAHSMGGLVSRYYIQALGGKDAVSKLVMLGTPNQGAMDSLKAVAEGEFPESIFHFYSKGSTRPIIFSWPSTFQLLPRYPECIKSRDTDIGPDLNGWGLGNTCLGIDDDGPKSDIVIGNWTKYNVIPPIEKSGGVESPEILKTYLKEQLTSAAKFHNAINGHIDETYEAEALSRIRSFGKTASIDLDTEENFTKGYAETPFIIFGGHCKPTTKYAFINSTTNGVAYLEFDNPDKNKEDNKSYTMGDGRVPISSLRLPQRANPKDFQFLLCEDHASLVSNTTFQYNLLRELLWQSSVIDEGGPGPKKQTDR